MQPVIYTSSDSQFREAVREEVQTVITREMPELIRKAVAKPYLTKAELMELTGWSSRQVEYKKSKRELPFIRRGRLVLFPSDEVFAYLEEGRVPARKKER